MPNNKQFELGQTVYYLGENSSILEGRICGYEAQFFAEWNSFSQRFYTNDWGDNHKLLKVCINIKNKTSDDNVWLRQDELYFSLSEAEDVISRNRKFELKRLKEKEIEIKKLIESYEKGDFKELNGFCLGNCRYAKNFYAKP